MFFEISIYEFIEDKGGELRIWVLIVDKNDAASVSGSYVQASTHCLSGFRLGGGRGIGQQPFDANGFSDLDRQIPAGKDFHFGPHDVITGFSTAGALDWINDAAMDVTHKELRL